MPPIVEDPFGLVGQYLEGRYFVQSIVASGGFGSVYLALHTTLQNRVAIKVLRINEDLGPAERQSIVDSFGTEARALAQLSHPSIVRALDFGVSRMPSGENAPWMCLEWIEGFTLRDDLRRRLGKGGRTPEECLHGLRPVIDALGYAHRSGLAHRDVKPANIMFDTRAGFAKILDFGIAKIMSPDEFAGTGHTETHAVFRAYSPSYAAPEQVTASRTGPWTDVHALGLILTEMLTDRIAYRTGAPQEFIAQAVAPIRPTPGAMGYDIGGWEAVLQRALALQPKDRYATAHELLAALEGALGLNASRVSMDPQQAQRVAPGVQALANAPRVSLPPTSGRPQRVSQPQGGHSGAIPRVSQPPATTSKRASRGEASVPVTTAQRTARAAGTLAMRAVLIAVIAGASGATVWMLYQRSLRAPLPSPASAATSVPAHVSSPAAPAANPPNPTTNPTPSIVVQSPPVNTGVASPVPAPQHPIPPQATAANGSAHHANSTQVVVPVLPSGATWTPTATGADDTTPSNNVAVAANPTAVPPNTAAPSSGTDGTPGASGPSPGPNTDAPSTHTASQGSSSSSHSGSSGHSTRSGNPSGSGSAIAPLNVQVE